jgi:predicted nucleotidyltransferase
MWSFGKSRGMTLFFLLRGKWWSYPRDSRMAESPHYKDLLQLLNEFEARYLIVGGYAVMKYTEPRFTKDLDVWVENSAENAIRVFEALKKFGAPLETDNISAQTFQRQGITYQIGIAPVRIDLLTQITGVEFSDAWKARVSGSIFGVAVHFISLEQLIVNKEAVGRSSDLEQLENIRKKTEPGA